MSAQILRLLSGCLAARGRPEKAERRTRPDGSEEILLMEHPEGNPAKTAVVAFPVDGRPARVQADAILATLPNNRSKDSAVARAAAWCEPA